LPLSLDARRTLGAEMVTASNPSPASSSSRSGTPWHRSVSSSTQVALAPPRERSGSGSRAMAHSPSCKASTRAKPSDRQMGGGGMLLGVRWRDEDERDERDEKDKRGTRNR
jgi:hypothetical protein